MLTIGVYPKLTQQSQDSVHCEQFSGDRQIETKL